jgi:PPP family 3-phenylpropionic acid transporter
VSPAARLGAFYFLYFSGVGLQHPYFPPYLLSLGFAGTQVAVIGSMGAVATLFVPPVWGYLADRTGRGEVFLRIGAAAGALGWTLVLGARSFPAVFGAMLLLTLATSSLSTLADSMATRVAREAGTDYARLRLWGSVGYVVASWGFGVALARGVEGRWVVPGLVALSAGTALWSWRLPAGPGPRGPSPSPGEAWGLVRRPALLCFLAAAMIHWAAFAPYNLFLATHLERVTGSRGYTGPSFALAVTAEVLVLWFFRSIARRVPLLPLLGAAFGLGAVRWLVTAGASEGWLLAVTQIAHGLCFGAFFVASLTHLERVVPERLRATGRALYGALVFGLGGIGGNALAGALFDAGGTRLAFGAAAGLEIGALVVLGAAAVLGREG